MNLYMMKLRAGDFEHDAEEAGVSADVQEALDELEKSRDDKLEAGAEEGFHTSIKSGTALYKRYYRWPTGWSCVLKSSILSRTQHDTRHALSRNHFGRDLGVARSEMLECEVSSIGDLLYNARPIV